MSDSSPSAFLLLAVRHHRSLMLAAALGGLTGGVVSIASPKQYKSASSFMIQNSQASLEGIAGLASQFGFRVPRGATGQAPEFYRDLLLSRPVLEAVMTRTFSRSPDEPAAALSAIAGFSEGSASEIADATAEWLREEVLRAAVSRETGVIRLTAVTGTPTLSRDLAAAVLAEAQAFDLRARRSQARAEREFLESRVDSTRAELGAAEAQLQRFLTENRSYRDSPALMFEFDRRTRAVTFRQQLYTTLAQAFEQARIEEVRATPVMTVLEAPVAPSEREPRGTVVKALGLAVVTASALFILIVIRESLATSADPNILEARRLAREAVSRSREGDR